MSILAVSMLTRPYTLTQTTQNTVKSSCKRGEPYVWENGFVRGDGTIRPTRLSRSPFPIGTRRAAEVATNGHMSLLGQ
jgi:hypothetical protein